MIRVVVGVGLKLPYPHHGLIPDQGLTDAILIRSTPGPMLQKVKYGP